MQAKIIGCYEKEPLTFVGMCAGVSTDKMDKGNLVKRAKRCFEEGHYSVMEHLKLTWVVSDVSRALTHQLVRHRHCSFTQESQRYTEVDVKNDWYVIPTDTLKTPDMIERYMNCMKEIGKEYNELISLGVPKEDARMLLPNACKTKIVVTMNMAEFAHFYRLRAEEHAQWEIRELAELMLSSIELLGGEWVDIADMIQQAAKK